MDEITRIKTAYAKRDSGNKKVLYSAFKTDSLFICQQREKALIGLLKKHGITDLSDKRILEIGCGKGNVLRDFISYGARPENCRGIDLLPDRIEEAVRISPNINFRCCSAENIICGDEELDIALVFTVFTSILDMAMKKRIACEILRILKPGGIIIWYDYHMDNPSNPDVRGVRKKEIYSLFPGCEIHLKRVTLAPPLARAISPVSVILAQIVEKIPFLCTHYIGIIRKA